MPAHRDQPHIEQLVHGWEQVHKNSQLTLWVMLAFIDGPKHMAEVKAFLERATNGTLNVDDKSLYRALRRYYDHELTEVQSAPGRGPDRKVYRLSAIGRAVLAQFVRPRRFAPVSDGPRWQRRLAFNRRPAGAGLGGGESPPALPS